MLERPRRVVLLIDYDNLQICASRDTPGRDLQLTPVVQLAQKYGTVILARAYAEWNLSTERLAVYKAGIEPAFAPVLRTESDRSGKSLADTVMVAEGMDMLWTLSPEVVVLATSDKDLIPLVRVAKQRGAFVVVLGSDFTAIPLREMADEHITYKQLITDGSGRYTAQAGPTREPAALPEPTRRRTRERNGREPRQAAAASTPTAPPPAKPVVESVVAPEPVAPVTSTTQGESDGPMGGRRRRRRGSRRRSERVGGAAEGTAAGEAAEGTSAIAPPEVTATPPPEPAPASEASPPVESAETPAPRTRRRRTTRATASASDAEPEQPAAEAAPAPPPSELASATPEPTNGTPTEEPARRPRARRVASASRGRTRSVR